MKKAIILILAMVIVLSSCSANTIQKSDDKASPAETESAVFDNSDTTSTINSDKTEEIETDNGGGEIIKRKYRQCYYDITYQLSLLVDKDELNEWKEDVFSKSPDETNEMIVKLFVQRFNISKEDFERASLELAKAFYDPDSPGVMMNPKDYVNQEMYEIYNADIIYTFDDEIINNYYLSGDYPFTYESEYEEAVAKGEYTSQTEKWIDIEEMEAEIIAKYGDAA